MVWRYVIDSPALASQQRGQREIVRTLFRTYKEAMSDKREAKRLVPGMFQRQLKELDAPPADGAPDGEARAARLAADIVANFSDLEAVAMFRRVTGISPGSLSDPLTL